MSRRPPPRFLLIATLVVALQSGPDCLAGDNTALPDLIDRVKPAVVGIGTRDILRRPPNQLRGTGFAVGDGSLIATNAHVVPPDLKLGKNEQIVVFAGTGSNPEVRAVARIADDTAHDLVLLRVEGKPLAALAVGESSAVREGTAVAFTGFPIGAVLGLYPVTHTGTISAITPIVIPARSARELTVEQIRFLKEPYVVFQLDATAYPGNSGSPVVRIDTGEVIGVVNSVFVKGKKENVLRDPSAITYAIPARYLQDLVARFHGARESQ